MAETFVAEEANTAILVNLANTDAQVAGVVARKLASAEQAGAEFLSIRAVAVIFAIGSNQTKTTVKAPRNHHTTNTNR